MIEVDLRDLRRLGPALAQDDAEAQRAREPNAPTAW